MSKISNCQRTETLRIWMIGAIKNKSKDCQMFVNPQKRRATSPHDINAPIPKSYEVEVQQIIEDDFLNT